MFRAKGCFGLWLLQRRQASAPEPKPAVLKSTKISKSEANPHTLMGLGFRVWGLKGLGRRPKDLRGQFRLRA